MFFLNRATSSGAMPGDAGFSTGLEFCRCEMERQLSYFRHALLWSFDPILLAIAIFVLMLATTRAIFPQAIPFITLAALWIAACLFIRARQQRHLKRELKEFNESREATASTDNDRESNPMHQDDVLPLLPSRGSLFHWKPGRARKLGQIKDCSSRRT
jgi:hypothetical protein